MSLLFCEPCRYLFNIYCFVYHFTNLFNVCITYTPAKLNPTGLPPANPRHPDEQKFDCHNSNPAISFHCQNPLPKDLYFYHLWYQNNVRRMLERIAVVWDTCMVRQTPVICLGVAGFTLIGAFRILITLSRSIYVITVCCSCSGLLYSSRSLSMVTLFMLIWMDHILDNPWIGLLILMPISRPNRQFLQ